MSAGAPLSLDRTCQPGPYANGETNRFTAIVKEYQGSEEVSRQRMYLEAMQEILPQVEQVYVVDSKQQNLLPLLDLSRKAAKEPSPAPASP